MNIYLAFLFQLHNKLRKYYILYLNVKTDEEFQQLIKKHETCLVDFTATWCGPGRMISPFVDQQAELFSKIKFVIVDVY